MVEGHTESPIYLSVVDAEPIDFDLGERGGSFSTLDDDAMRGSETIRSLGLRRGFALCSNMG